MVRDERGAILVIVAMSLSAILAFALLVVEVGNWHEHKRHLQLQADAAALAGADSFALPLAACSNATIASVARAYAGPDATTPGAPYNAQVSNTPAARLHVLLNSPPKKYWPDSGSGDNLDGTPCDKLYLDVKITEASIPWLFLPIKLLGRINAHARVSILSKTTGANSLPIAVPNPTPGSAGVLYVDESKPGFATDASAVLGKAGMVELAPDSSGLDKWSTDFTAPTSFQIPNAPSGGSERVGVIVVLSGATALDLTGSVATVCAQPLVSCYDSSNDPNPPSNGLDFVRGWSTGGSALPPNPPLARDVELFYTGGCSDPWFVKTAATCNVGIEAKIDAGVVPTSALTIAAFSASPNASGCLKNPAGCALTVDAGSAQCSSLGGTGTCWRSTTIPVAANAGALPLTLSWTLKAAVTILGKNCATGQGCSGDFEGNAAVQRVFSATDTASGPIQVATLYNCDGGCAGLSGTQSFPSGTTHSFGFAIGIVGSLQDATDKFDANATCGVNSLGEHFSCLKVVVQGKSGNTQALDCDDMVNQLWEELAYGCGPSYTVNTGTPDCTTSPWKSSQGLWGQPQPWPCIATETGGKPPDVAKGLNQRIFGDPNKATCTSSTNVALKLGDPGYNNWELFPNLPSGDPRIVDTFLTSFNAFSNTSGKSTVPVRGFATFYITGYVGQGGKAPCKGFGDDPVPGNTQGLITGHFIKYIDKINSGGGTTPCVPTDFTSCVAVLTD